MGPWASIKELYPGSRQVLLQLLKKQKAYIAAVILFVRISLEEQTVNLDKPFANGLACKFPQVTINANDIQVKQQLFSRPEI